jgi:drug/metabolite transporter (DMT)-like permease
MAGHPPRIRAGIMSALTLAAALAAAMTWAAASLLAHAPAGKLGALAFTRIQLAAASLVLLTIATARGAWTTVAWSYWPELAVSGLVGVLLCNLALIACLRRGGPRRCLLLLAMNAPIAAMLGYVYGGETASLQSVAGGALTLSGVILAVLYGRKRDPASDALRGSAAIVLLLGLAAAACHAIGLVAIKPAMLAGTDPVAASALRIAGSAAILALTALWPAKASATPLSAKLVLQTIAPGLLGYVVATTLLLYALRSYNAGIVVALGSTAPVMILPVIWATTGERPRAAAWIAAILTVLGSALISTG